MLADAATLFPQLTVCPIDPGGTLYGIEQGMAYDLPTIAGLEKARLLAACISLEELSTCSPVLHRKFSH